jgi:hypothetical protein
MQQLFSGFELFQCKKLIEHLVAPSIVKLCASAKNS